MSGIGVQAAPAAGEAVHGAGDVGAGLALAARFPIVGIAAVCLCAGHAGLGLFRAVSGKVSARQTGAGVGGGRRGQGEHFRPAFAVVRGLVRGDEFKAVLPLLGGHRAAADFLARHGIAPYDLHRRPIFKAVAGDGFKPFAGTVFRCRFRSLGDGKVDACLVVLLHGEQFRFQLVAFAQGVRHFGAQIKELFIGEIHQHLDVFPPAGAHVMRPRIVRGEPGVFPRLAQDVAGDGVAHVYVLGVMQEGVGREFRAVAVFVRDDAAFAVFGELMDGEGDADVIRGVLLFLTHEKSFAGVHAPRRALWGRRGRWAPEG